MCRGGSRRKSSSDEGDEADCEGQRVVAYTIRARSLTVPALDSGIALRPSSPPYGRLHVETEERRIDGEPVFIDRARF